MMVEYVDPSTFEEEPGRIIEPGPPPADEQLEITTEPTAEEPEGAETPGGEDTPGGSEPTEAELMRKLEAVESERDNFRTRLSQQGQELHTLRTAMQMVQGQGVAGPQARQQPQVEIPDDVDPATAQYFERRLQEVQQQNFFLDTARKDAEFKVQKGITPDIDTAVQTYQALNGIMSFKDAYHSMVAQNYIVEDKKPSTPTRRVAVEPSRQGPKVVSGGGKAPPPAGNLTPATVDWDKLAKADAQTKKETLRRFHELTSGGK